jgi:hypothetical protein
MAKRVSVGMDMYLFMNDDKVPASHLVVSSHGGFDPNAKNGWLTVPQGMELFFYVPDAVELVDPAVSNVLGYDPEEIHKGGAVVRNYELSKYQGRHTPGGSETYASIENAINRSREQIEAQARDLRADFGIDLSDPATAADPAAAYATTRAAVEATNNPMRLKLLDLTWAKRRYEAYDVLTVRFRFPLLQRLGRGVTLRDVLKAVEGKGYKKIHCSFCRSEMGVEKPPKQSPKDGTTWLRKPDGFRH